MSGVTTTKSCIACVQASVSKALAAYGAGIRTGVAAKGLLEAAAAGADSTVDAILNRVLIDEQAKILADTSCCSALSRTRKRRTCIKYALPPIQVERP
jgi:F0F1-type ATP synthase membrane subunit c/vacuolar-type H+-ATPase subunit K